jgi:hypothetical protein
MPESDDNCISSGLIMQRVKVRSIVFDPLRAVVNRPESLNY